MRLEAHGVTLMLFVEPRIACLMKAEKLARAALSGQGWRLNTHFHSPRGPLWPPSLHPHWISMASHHLHVPAEDKLCSFH